MLKITVLAVGKLKEEHWRSAQAEYLKRLKPFGKIEVIETAAAPITASVNADLAMKKEGAVLLKRLPADALAVALDRTGERLDSEGLAEWLGREGGAGRHLVLIVGGAAGLDMTVLAEARKKVSLSALTFTHEMARLILLEQLYRAATILAGKKYHY